MLRSGRTPSRTRCRTSSRRALRREADAAAAQREIENFTAEFKNAARKCFQLIDKDQGGTLSHEEIVEAVKSDKEVIKFLTTCGDENLSFLLHPPRLKKALEALDEDKSGEIDIEEWCGTRRPSSRFTRHRRRRRV